MLRPGPLLTRASNGMYEESTFKLDAAPSIKFHLIFVARLYISGFGQIEEKKWCKVITCRSCSTYSHHKASSNTINNILLCESSQVESSQIKSSRADSSLS